MGIRHRTEAILGQPHTRRGRALGCALAAALVLALPTGSIDVVGVDNVATPEPCVIGDVTVAPTDDGTHYTGFTITNPSATSGCSSYDRYIYVRAMYDTNADGEADGSYYMTVPAQAYTADPLGIFGGKPAVWTDNHYKVKATTPPLMSGITFLRYYSMVNSRRDDIVP